MHPKYHRCIRSIGHGEHDLDTIHQGSRVWGMHGLVFSTGPSSDIVDGVVRSISADEEELGNCGVVCGIVEEHGMMVSEYVVGSIRDAGWNPVHRCTPSLVKTAPKSSSISSKSPSDKSSRSSVSVRSLSVNSSSVKTSSGVWHLLLMSSLKSENNKKNKRK